MTAFAQTLELECKKLGIPILSVMTAGNKHLADGKICSHTPKMSKSKKLITYEILQCLYVDDGTFPFGTREDLQRGMESIYHHFAQFELEMHIGRGTSESKTDCVFPPHHNFSNAWSGQTLRLPQFNVHSVARTTHTPDT
jgi:hypothetical protein